ncbi:uncharacterized protein LOC132169566 [Corylus avellana]|uniref:uncharacterized protein LOC132169566 n=1 Tax=Corylus avellana TaxID=13451 RepID=UPI00286C4896|nr:uncharacterized protein LOC132169566 [Corylus avellana]
MATGTCYRYDQFDHFSKDCVSKGNAQKPLAPTQVYVLVIGETKGESEGELEVVASIVPILGFEASVLFNSGPTHSFVSFMFVRLSRLVVRTLETGLAVTTPVGKTVVCKCAICGCPIHICGRILPANLVVLPMNSYNVILRMDWLVKHLAVIDCARKQVTLKLWGEGEVTYVGSRMRSFPPTISAVRAKKLILGGGQAFLAFVITVTKEKKKDLQDIPVV